MREDCRTTPRLVLLPDITMRPNAAPGFLRGQRQLLSLDNDGETSREFVRRTGDVHYLWVAPNNYNRMIESNDGGAIVSTNGGRTWTTRISSPQLSSTAWRWTMIFPTTPTGHSRTTAPSASSTRSDDSSVGRARNMV